MLASFLFHFFYLFVFAFPFSFGRFELLHRLRVLFSPFFRGSSFLSASATFCPLDSSSGFAFAHRFYIGLSLFSTWLLSVSFSTSFPVAVPIPNVAFLARHSLFTLASGLFMALQTSPTQSSSTPSIRPLSSSFLLGSFSTVSLFGCSDSVTPGHWMVYLLASSTICFIFYSPSSSYQ